jgi:hypothetical protein
LGMLIADIKATQQEEVRIPTYLKGHYCDEPWLNRNEESASIYIRKVTETGQYANLNTNFVQLPHKLLRCLGLTTYEKIILTDLIAYMGKNNYCYPTQETIALNINASSKTVSDHLKSLNEKDIVWVDYRDHNNVYYLAANLQDNPYIILSELTHQFIREKRNFVNEKKLLARVKVFVSSEKYADYAKEIQSTYKESADLDDYSNESEKVLETIERFKKNLKDLKE